MSTETTQEAEQSAPTGAAQQYPKGAPPLEQKESLVTLTANTVEKLKSIIANDPEAKGKALRIGLESGGCSGYQYVFTFDTKKENDHVIASDGVEVLIDDKTGEMLKGSVIDYTQDFGGEGFAINNPNVKKSCGCGHSVDI